MLRLLRKTLLLILISAPLISLAATNIAILVDGKSRFYDEIIKHYQNEIIELTEGEFETKFMTHFPSNDDWTYQNIQNKYYSLQASENVDIVLALGLISGLVAVYDSAPNKPTFAAYIFDADFPGIPREGLSSGVKNLSYLAEEIALQNDLEQFQTMTGFKHLVVLLDESIFKAVKDLHLKVQEVTKQLGAKVSFILQNEKNQNLLTALPEDTDAVIITALQRLDKPSLQALIDGLNARKIPTYSVIEPELVRDGVLMTTESQADDLRRARRTALNIQATLLGDEPAYFPVLFTPQEKLVINMQTAREIGFYPRFDILSQATLLNEEPIGEEPALSLQDVAHEAIKANLSIIASRLDVLAGKEDVKITRSALFPQLSIDASSSRQDDDITVASGTAAEGTTSGNLTLEQVIYSESTRSDYDIQKLEQLSIEAQHRALELDIVQQATVDFLDILRAQTQVNIDQYQLNLSLINLSVAKNKQQVGSANAADVYRFESEIATDRQTLLQSQARLRQAGEALNNLLHRPISVIFKTTPATLEHDEVLFHGSDLDKFIDNGRTFDLFKELYIKLGQQMSPEVAEQDALIAVSERQLTASRRSYYVPDITLQGNSSRVFDEYNRQAGTSQEGVNDWEISLNLSLPLYQGGQRKANVSKAAYQLHQNKVLREKTLREIEQNVRQYFHDINASYPSIELSELAYKSAQQNYSLVKDNYSQGTVSIADFIDAQNSALTAEQDAANAIYDFLIDLMNLQRSIGAFDYFLDEPSRQERIDLIKNYLESGGQK